MSEIKERLIRRNDDDVMYIADIVERAKRTDFWQLLMIMTEGRKVHEIENSKATINYFPAERVLGRIEAYETLVDDMESWIDQATSLRQPVQRAKMDDEVAKEISSTAEISEAGFSYGAE